MPSREKWPRAAQSPVTVEIGELVLHGFPSAQRDAIAAAFGDRLAELIGEHGAPALVPVAADGLNAEAFSVGTEARPDAVGRAAAHSVYHAIRWREC